MRVRDLQLQTNGHRCHQEAASFPDYGGERGLEEGRKEGMREVVGGWVGGRWERMSVLVSQSISESFGL